MLALHFSPRGRGSVVLVLAARVVGHLLDIDGALRAKVLDTPGVITSVHSRVDREPCPPGNATTGRRVGGWAGGEFERWGRMVIGGEGSWTRWGGVQGWVAWGRWGGGGM